MQVPLLDLKRQYGSPKAVASFNLIMGEQVASFAREFALYIVTGNINICGEKGSGVYEIKTWVFSDKQDYDEEDSSAEDDSVYGEVPTPLYFLDAIMTGKDPRINCEGGKKALAVVLRADEVSST